MSVVIDLETTVPENRQVVLKLPPNVPVGPARIVVSVGDTMEQTRARLGANPPCLALPPRPEHPKLAREFDAFQQQLTDLLKSHSGEYVAIHNGQVVASGKDPMQVIHDAYARYGYQAIYLVLVTDQAQPIGRSGVVRE